MEIKVLSKETIDKIAAGEVIERPSSVVKELVENAIDAKATAITVEIKNGGIDLIRVTDNGCGIEKEQVQIAFFAHATSKIRDAADLDEIRSLGFRGEALSSIAAVSEVELITKTREALLGTRYLISGSKEEKLEEIGAPDGCTFLVRNLFYNTPARRKFLKSPQTEAGYINALLERIALSHPELSFKFISNGTLRLQTAGNDLSKDIIYHIYGREIASSLIPVEAENEFMSIKGFIGKPAVTRGNRNFENYFVNGRYVKSQLLAKGIEDAYRSYLMQHQYPFTVLSLTVDGQDIDVNVHPQKLELRFSKADDVYQFVVKTLTETLSGKELIPEVPVGTEKKEDAPAPKTVAPEPFETKRMEELREAIRRDSPYEAKYERTSRVGSTSKTGAGSGFAKRAQDETGYDAEKSDIPRNQISQEQTSQLPAQPVDVSESQQQAVALTATQETLPFLSEDSKPSYRILGQAFKTYWIVEFTDKLFLIDQHAAHEKVIFERLMRQKKERVGEVQPSQQVSPPLLMTLSLTEEETLKAYEDEFTALGFELSHFGGKEYAITGIPANLYGLDEARFFIEMLDDLAENGRVRDTDELYLKIATMSCKAAIKGGDEIGLAEFTALLDELLTLENPYNCPHGRPTIISMSRYELERKFKRVVG